MSSPEPTPDTTAATTTSAAPPVEETSTATSTATPSTTPSSAPSTTSSTPSSTATTSTEPTTTEPETTTEPIGEPTPDPERPEAADQAALFDAIANENAVIFGYGIVSAHSAPEINALVSEALLAHRGRREEALALATRLDSPAPLPAVGYALPMSVNTPTDAGKLAVRMEEDCATAWRAVLESTSAADARKMAVTAMTDSAVFAARWRAQLDLTPVTVAFPGGNE